MNNTLHGLPGRSEKETPFRRLKTPAQAVKSLTKKHAVSTAGDNGALTAWRQDDGTFRAERYFYCKMVDQWTGPSKAGLREWLEDQLSKIQ